MGPDLSRCCRLLAATWWCLQAAAPGAALDEPAKSIEVAALLKGDNSESPFAALEREHAISDTEADVGPLVHRGWHNTPALKTSANGCSWSGPKACKVCAISGCTQWVNKRRGIFLMGSLFQPNSKRIKRKSGDPH